MKKSYILLLAIAFLGTTLFAQAPDNSVWKNEGAAANWNTVEGWTNGLPGANTKTVFNVAAGSDCIIDTDDAVVKQLVVGDNTPYGGKLIIEDGGVLTCSDQGDWSTIGYNEAGTMAIKAGGAMVVQGNRFHVGLVDPKADAIVVSLDVEGTLTTPKFTVNDGGKAWDASTYVYNGGMIETNVLWVGTGGLLDISGGKIIVTPNEHNGAATIATVNEIVADGRVTAEGGDEAPTVEISTDSVITITSSTTVGFAEKFATREASLSVYPNPATDVVYFKENLVADVEIFSISGQMVMRETRVNQVNVDGLKAGIYFIKAKANNKLFVDKFIKE